MMKRFMSLMLVVCMVLTMLPATAAAVEAEEQIALAEAVESVQIDPDLEEDETKPQHPHPGSTALASGYCGGEGDGTNLTWTLYVDGDLVIEGSGAMADWSSTSGIPWYSNRGSIKCVTIESGVTTIGTRAFYECDSLTDVTIPNSVTVINNKSFYGCDGLVAVTIPGSVANITAEAFYKCKKLVTVTLEHGLTTIGYRAFSYCDKLADVTIPDSVTSIGNEAFYSCDALAEVVIPDMVTSIGSKVFYSCNGLTSVTFGTGVTTMKESAFYGCVCLTDVEFMGDAPASVEANVFADCSADLTIYYHEGTTGWPADGQWQGYPLVMIEGEKPEPCYNIYVNDVYGGFVMVDRDSAAEGELVTVTVEPDGAHYFAGLYVNGMWQTELEFVMPAEDVVLTVEFQPYAAPDPYYNIYVNDVYGGFVMVDRDSAAEGELVTVTVEPDGGYYFVGLYVNGVWQTELEFIMPAEDVELTAEFEAIVYSVTVGNVSNGTVTTDKDSGVMGDVINVTAQPDEGYTFDQILVNNEAISGTNFVMPARDVVVTVDFYAIVYDVMVGDVSNGSLTVDKETATKGETVTVTAEPAEGYKFVSLSVNGVKQDSLTFTMPAEDVVLTAEFQPYVDPEPEPDPNVIASGTCGGEGDGTNLTWTLYVDGELVIEGSGAMEDWDYYSDTPWDSNRSSIIKVTIGDSVTTIGDSAFDDCDSLTEVILGDSVTTIGGFAFEYCDSLTKVSIPDSVTNVGVWAFSDCDSLTEVILGDSVTTIWEWAFYGCDSLTEVILGDSVTAIGAFAFSWCDSLTMITVSDGNRSYCDVGGVLFNKDKTVLIQYPGGKTGAYTIPDSVTIIGDYAFGWCDSLTEVILGDSVTTICERAFYWCDSLTRVEFLGNVPTLGDSVFADCSADLTIYYHEGTTGWPADGQWQGYPLVMIEGEKPEPCYNIYVNDVYGGFVMVDRDSAAEGELVTVTVEPDGAHYFAGLYVNGVWQTELEFIMPAEDVVLTAEFQPYVDPEPEPEPNVIASGYCGGEGDGTNLTWTLYVDGELVIEGSGAMEDWGSYTDAPWQYNCNSITKVTIGAGVTTLGAYAFYCFDSLTEVTIPDSVTTIGYRAFYFCSSLVEVAIPNNVTTIEDDAFTGCSSLTEMAIPDGVTVIGDHAFGSCDSLTMISVSDGNRSYCDVGGVLFNKDKTLLIQYPGGKTGAYTIPDSVTTIANEAFRYSSSLTKVTIPDSVTTIGDDSFAFCFTLTEVTMGDNVTTFGEGAFYACYSLTEVIIGDSVTTIGDYAFSDCYSLNEVTIPDCVTTIGDYAFRDCSNLIRVEFLGNAPTSVGDYAFANCSADLTIYYHEGTTGWPADGQWQGRPLVMIEGEKPEPYYNIYVNDVYGGFVMVDRDSAAEGELVTVTVEPDSGYYFAGLYVNGMWQTELEFIMPAEDVVLTAEFQLYVDPEPEPEPNVIASGTCGGEGDGTNLIWTLYADGELVIEGTGAMENYDYGEAPWYGRRSKIKTVSIRNGVTTIGEWAFGYCHSMTSVVIGDSVTTIGEWAFYDCDSLTMLTIPDSVTTIGDRAFCACHSLTSVVIGDSVTTIGDGAFASCDSLTTITIPDSVTTIGDSAFASCDSLTTVVIGDSVTTIGDDAFYYCSSLTTITIPDSVTTIGDSAFAECNDLTTVTIPDSVTTIGDSAFCWCSSLTTITIPDSVTTIGDRAFYSCYSLTTITIPDSVTTIGDEAFSDCGSLTDIEVLDNNKAYCDVDGVLFSKDETTLLQYPGGRSGEYTIPDSVTTIGEGAFHWCESLTTITISDSVTTIGEWAFGYCLSLTSVVIGDSVTTIGDDAFYYCSSLTTITIPDSVTTIGDSAFAYCYSLTEVTIGKGVTTIGDYVFAYCDRLTRVEFLGNAPTSVGDYAFADCSADPTIYYHEGTTGWPADGKWQGYPLVMIPAEEERELSWSAEEQELLSLINKERLANGLSPLSVSVAMLEAADMREQDFISRYGTNRPDGTSGLSVLDIMGISYTTASELMAVGQSTPQAVLNYWMKNESYRAEILNPNYAHVGVGYTSQSCTITTETGVGRIRGGWVLQFMDDDCTATTISLSKNAVLCETGSLENLGLLVKESCSVHGTCYLPLADELCTGFNPDVSGEQVVTVSYKGCSVPLQVTVPQGVVIMYRVTVGEVFNGGIVVDRTSATVGTQISVTVTPDAGYEFAGLFVNGEKQDGLTFTMPAEDVVLTAEFKAIVYSVTVGNVSNGTVTTDKDSGVMGDVINVTAQPDEGYTFDQILVNNEAISGTNFVMPARDVVVTVDFYAIAYDVMVGDVSNGSLTVDKETATKGETVTVTAEPAEGYKFVSLSVNGVKQDGLTFVMPAEDVVLTAEFVFVVSDTYTITVGEVFNGTIKPSVNVAEKGETITVTVTPDAGCKLVEIRVDGEPINGNTFAVTGDHVVTATFEKIADAVCTMLSKRTAYIRLDTQHKGNAVVAFYAADGRMLVAKQFDVSKGVSDLIVESVRSVLAGAQCKVFLLDEQGNAICSAIPLE